MKYLLQELAILILTIFIRFYRVLRSNTIKLFAIITVLLSTIEAFPQGSISFDPEIRRFIIQEELENNLIIEVPWFDLQISGIDTLDTAWVLPDTLSARDVGTFKIRYIPRGSGFASNGVIIFKTPFGWQPSSKSWTYPQISRSSDPGYVTISSSNVSSEFNLSILRNGYDFLIRAESSSLPPQLGDTLTLRFGDTSISSNGATVSHVSASKYGFSILVDKNNRGTFSVVLPEPFVIIEPRSVQKFLLTAPSFVRIGEEEILTITALDEYNNRVHSFTGSLSLDCPVTGCAVPALVMFEEADSGSVSIGVTINDSSMHQIRATDSTGVIYLGNPIVGNGSDVLYNLYWGDLQNHTDLSDGTGSIREFYYYARYVADLDFVAMTDHDHLIETDYLTPAVWNMVTNAAEQYNNEGNFVTFLGWEYTLERGGHRHVLFRENNGEVYSWKTHPLPTDLWNALGGVEALTIPHHVQWKIVPGRPINWTFRNDRYQGLVEIYSMHSACEYWGNPLDWVIESHRARGHYVRDALSMGHKLGFLASSDGHFGYPGNGWAWARTALDSTARGTGLVGIYADTLTRASLYDALKAKRVYGTTDHRTIVQFHVNGAWMGETISSDSLPNITGKIYSHTPLKSAEIVKYDGKEYSFISLEVSENIQELSFSVKDSTFVRSSFYYLRVVSEGNLNDRFAWSSPVWVSKPLLQLTVQIPALDEYGYISDGDTTHPTEGGFTFRSTSPPFSESTKIQFEVFDISDSLEAALYVNGIYLLSLPVSPPGEWGSATAVEIPRYLVDTTNVLRFESYRNLAGELDQWGVRNVLLGSPVIEVAPSDSLHFGEVVGTEEDTLIFTVINNGVATLVVAKIIDPDSSLGVNPSAFILAPNESLDVDVWLNVSVIDSFKTNLEIYSNDPVTQVYQLVVDAKITISVEDRNKQIPVKYELSQNYPNPFNAMTLIYYSIPKYGNVTLTVYNLLGEEVARLVDSVQSPGFKQETWNASNFASGIYFYRLQAGSPAGGFVQTKKMVLLK